jgi:hypothetical protein
LHRKILMTTTYTAGTSRTFIIQCKQCNQSITFDDKHISLRTGKKIPLDVNTGQRHDCPGKPVQQSQPLQQQQQKGRRYLPCSKRCGSEIYFDENSKTSTGKWIPLSKATGEPHQCQ